MHSEANIIFQVSIAIVTATAGAFLAKLLRQPLLLGYLAAGIVIGETQGFGLIQTATIEPIAELGLILLLFMIGLEIDLHKLKGSGGPVIAAGLLQFPIGVVLGLLVAPLLGFHFATGQYAPLYIAVAAALASTMIVVKLLYDRHELDTLPGRITLGVLVFQDLWAILFLAVQPDLRNPAPGIILLSLVKAALLVAFALLVSSHVLPALFRFIAKVPELMVSGALAWCFLVALIAQQLGLSLEMGALIAGVSLSTFPYNLDVIAKVISLRDFFITLFFVTLGTSVPQPDANVLGAAVALSGFLVLSRFAALTPLLYAFKRGNRASVIPAINLSQISEFSLVICSIGLSLGHIDQRTLSVAVFTLVITAVTSTYAIQYNHQIYAWLNRWLPRLGLRDLDEHAGELRATIAPKPILFVGFYKHGSSVLHDLLARDAALREKISVVDFNPHSRDGLERLGIATLYGDVSNADTLHHVHASGSSVLACTLPDGVLRGSTNLKMLRTLRAMAPKARVIVTSDSLRDAAMLYAEGASFVYIPRLMGSAELAEVIHHALYGDVAEHRAAAEAALRERDEVLP